MSIKKIIAREGLIVLVIIVVGGAMLFLSSKYPPMPSPVSSDNPLGRSLIEKNLDCLGKESCGIQEIGGEYYSSVTIYMMNKARAKIKTFGIITLCLIYPLYLLIRFVIWAVRILKEKK